MAKAIATFITALVAMLAAFGLNTGEWITPNLIDVVASLVAALVPTVQVWLHTKKITA
jgi:hypothetical protein